MNNKFKNLVFLANNKKLITLYDFKNRTLSTPETYEIKTSKTSSYIEFSMPNSKKRSRTFLRDIKSKIKNEIKLLLENNAYKTSIKPYGSLNNNYTYMVDFYKIKSFNINYVMKTHFLSGSINIPPGVNNEDAMHYTGLVSEQIRNIDMNTLNDQVFIVDISMKLSTFGSDPKSRKKSICKYHEKQYSIHKNKSKKKLKKTQKKIKKFMGINNNNNNEILNNNENINNTRRNINCSTE